MSIIQELDRTHQIFDGLVKKYQDFPFNGVASFNSCECASINAMQIAKIIVRNERRQRLFDLAKEVKSNIDFLKDCPLTLNQNV